MYMFFCGLDAYVFLVSPICEPWTTYFMRPWKEQADRRLLGRVSVFQKTNLIRPIWQNSEYCEIVDKNYLLEYRQANIWSYSIHVLLY